MKRKFLFLFLTVLVIGVLFVCYGISESSKGQVDQASTAISELTSIPARTLVTKVFDNAGDYDAFINSIWMRQNRYEVFSHEFTATSVVLNGEIVTNFYFTVTYFARY